MSKRTVAVAAGDDGDKGLLPSSCELWPPPRLALAYDSPLRPGAIVLPVDAGLRKDIGESPPLAEAGETGSTMARADADEISVLEDVSGRGLMPAERGGHG